MSSILIQLSHGKSILKGQTEFTEFICDPDMRLFGYEPQEYSGGGLSTAAMEFFSMMTKQPGVGEEGMRPGIKKLLIIWSKRINQNNAGDSSGRIENYFLFEEVLKVVAI